MKMCGAREQVCGSVKSYLRLQKCWIALSRRALSPLPCQSTLLPRYPSLSQQGRRSSPGRALPTSFTRSSQRRLSRTRLCSFCRTKGNAGPPPAAMRWAICLARFWCNFRALTDQSIKPEAQPGKHPCGPITSLLQSVKLERQVSSNYLLLVEGRGSGTNA